MSTSLTSATYTVWRFLARFLSELQFPAPPQGDDPVAIWFGDGNLPPEDIRAALERIVVQGVVQAPTEEWGPVGQLAREERFRIPLYVATSLRGRTAEQAADRLEELTATIESGLRDVNAGYRAGQKPAEFADYQVAVLGIGSVVPATPAADSGYTGVASVAIDCRFRIGTPPVS